MCVVDPEMFRSVFGLQEKIVDDILRSVEEQRALEAAPRSVDPIQQTVATVIQSYLNHPDIERLHAIESIKFLNQPMLAVQVRRLRQGYREFQNNGDIAALLNSVENLRATFSGVSNATDESRSTTNSGSLKREDLRLICFDLLSAA